MLQILKKQEDTDMKVCEQKNEVTLRVHGRERTFLEQELLALLELATSDNVIEPISMTKVAQTPTAGYWFKVDPLSIDEALFKDKRDDFEQEKTRLRILKAFENLKTKPERYGRAFMTMIPDKAPRGICWLPIEEVKRYACKFGGHTANIVEQAFEWAQRIANGENWETVCNEYDTTPYYRLVISEYNGSLIIGGAKNYGTHLCGSSYIRNPLESVLYDPSNRRASPMVEFLVPLVARYI